MVKFLRLNLLGIFLFYIALSLGVTSCITPKKIIYFGDVRDSSTTTDPYVINNVTKFVSPTILTNDILLVTVQTQAQSETSNPLQTAKSAFDPLSGFLVDKNGNIEVALIGFVKVAGLTTAEARELVKEKAKEFYKDPVVNVRIANFDVYYLGEINAKGSISFPSEKVNILEAISAGGDMPITGRRQNVLLIRTEGDTKKLVRFDLTSSSIFRSPYFYLKQRDILYVEPSKYKIQASDNRITRTVSILGGVISLAGILLAFRSIK